MSTNRNDAILELLSNFIHFRQTGTARDAAWQQVLKHASEIPLSTDEVMQLLALAKSWEKREGYKYRFDERESTQTDLLDHEKLKSIAPPSEDTEATVRLVNPATEQAIEQSTYFDDQTQLLLHFEGAPTPFKIYVPKDKEVLIGRSTANTIMTPDIDLSSLNGVSYGISRLHASLQQRNYTLLIADLGSRNHTFVNGTRLHPHEVRVLKQGDELKLAALKAKVSFSRP
ncbi:MAG: FHA domain-containing protein [Anaerolineae bacterium]|nr:FHA domain-containing protein [Anaerolineae bacterium]